VLLFVKIWVLLRVIQNVQAPMLLAVGGLSTEPPAEWVIHRHSYCHTASANVNAIYHVICMVL